MPELLLELFSEEIPAGQQVRASENLKKQLTDALVENGLIYEGARAYSTPRRLVLHVVGLPAKQPDTKTERKGPRVGAPEKALEGFLRAAGLSSVDEAQIVNDPKKGDFYVAVIEKTGRPTEEVIAEKLKEIIENFSWPKSMRWGDGALRWIRPLQSILCTFGPETEDPKLVHIDVPGVDSGNVTYGHRFLSTGPITVRRFDDYSEALEKAHVVLDPERRKEIIRHEAKNLCFAQQLELVEDEGLLNEVAGLVEWPQVLMGEFDASYLDVPQEVLTTSMKSHQKCFSVKDPATGKLTNKFIPVSNLIAKDGGKAIIDGNQRVIAARLSDAKFFWDLDRKTKLEDQLEKLKNVTFHEKLGTQFERVERISKLARELAPIVGADPDLAERAAKLCKADLVSEMVGEFPELQGLMGRYYASDQGEAEMISAALEDHYRPQGPSDNVPTEPVSIAVALADKLDILIGFWTIDEKPTGSKDPFALRRAALGVVRTLIENRIKLDLSRLLKSGNLSWFEEKYQGLVVQLFGDRLQPYTVRDEMGLSDRLQEEGSDFLVSYISLAHFILDRLKVYLRDQGYSHDMIDAVITPQADDLLMIVKRVDALKSMLSTDDGQNLLAGVKRANNILAIEEKKDGKSYSNEVDAGLIDAGGEAAEKALYASLQSTSKQVDSFIDQEDFEAAMRSIASLRPAVDGFFDSVVVNSEDPKIRENRLALLAQLRSTTLKVADFSKLEG